MRNQLFVTLLLDKQTKVATSLATEEYEESHRDLVTMGILPHSHSKPESLRFAPGGGQAVVCSTLLPLYRNQGLESSSAESLPEHTHTHTPFHCSPKKYSTHSHHTGSFKESSQNPGLKLKKGLQRKERPLLCRGHKHTDTNTFWLHSSLMCA